MRLTKFLVLLCVLSVPTTGLAVVDFQVLAGKRIDRMAELKGQKFSLNATDITGSVHYAPIPAVPIGFGVAMSSLTFDSGGSDFPYSKFTGTEMAVEINFWSPTKWLGCYPYGKIGALTGSYKRTDRLVDATTQQLADYSATYKSSGPTIAFGFKWSTLPLTDILFEVDHRFLILNPTKIELAGAEQTTTDQNVRFYGASILLGLEVGL